MLSKKERLSRVQFSEILTNKGILVVYNNLGTLKYVNTATRALSVVTSGKHEKKAVSRNKLRRRVYSLFDKENRSIQGILYASKGAYLLSYGEIKRLFNELLNKTQKTTK